MEITHDGKVEVPCQRERVLAALEEAHGRWVGNEDFRDMGIPWYASRMRDVKEYLAEELGEQWEDYLEWRRRKHYRADGTVSSIQKDWRLKIHDDEIRAACWKARPASLHPRESFYTMIKIGRNRVEVLIEPDEVDEIMYGHAPMHTITARIFELAVDPWQGKGVIE